jgi:4-hydroxy-3-methylbut-2-enyl diphosphate reductase
MKTILDERGLVVRRAEHLGMCFGVRDAIHLARQESARQPITVLGELVHNPDVLRDLESRGVQFAATPAGARTNTVMVTAHGTSGRTLAALRDGGFNVLESTCPLVHFAHRMLAGLVARGFHPIVIGRRDHVEVRGLTGDLDAFDVVLEPADIDRLQPRDRFGVVSQTTQPIARVRELVALLRARFPNAEVCFRDTVCQPTKQRQAAAIELARASEVVIVIGGANSNNTRELVAACSRHCDRVHHVQGAPDLRAEWFTGVCSVGITAGTSTPDDTIAEVEEWIRDFCGENKRGRNSNETLAPTLRA